MTITKFFINNVSLKSIEVYLLTGTVGKANACAGIGWVGKEEAGKEMVALFAAAVVKADMVDVFDAVLPEAICCI